MKTANAARELQNEIKAHITQLLNTNYNNIIPAGKFRNTLSIEGITIRKFLLEPEAGIMLPGFILEPDKFSNREVVLYLNENGKAKILNDFETVKKLLNKGYSICAVDLRGIGETSPDMANKFWDFLSGKPIFGQRVRDVLTTIQWLKDSEVKAQRIKIWGTGMCALYGAFAGVFNNDVSGFVLEEPLISFESIVRVTIPGYNHEILLPGVLENFDMPQIYQSLCPRPVFIMNPYSGDKMHANEDEIKEAEKSVSVTYHGLKSSRLWEMRKVDENEREEVIVNGLTLY